MTESPATFATLQLNEAARVHAELASDEGVARQLEGWSDYCVEAIRSGGTIFFAGNGGSFADAQHLAAELTGKMGRVRDPLAGVALGTNSSSMTAIANDFDYDDVFARECRALASRDSVIIALTTSGNSSNILKLVETANRMGIKVLALTGETPGAVDAMCETIKVPSSRTERIQEMHILLGHTLCLLIEETLVFADQRDSRP